ncbi:MAG TPA: FAD-dependent oxidoreductase [Clostridiales bacterium]|nr:FAD-dependent oxidoreductase [Clostridiales bacterium]
MKNNNDKQVVSSKGNKKLVKCIVCGAIFDEDIDICPVCGVGREYFIPYEEEAVSYKKDTDESFIILGNGIAGISAAEAIRERNSTCKITLISKESVYGYNRPLLTKTLSSLERVDDILIYDKEWYEQNNINNILDMKIKKINKEEKSIEFIDGNTMKYDKCIYALGAKCFIPPFKGADKSGVIAIRDISDVLKVREEMKTAKNVVVIGGGVLGLEAAWELSKNAKVTVLEIADKLMVRQLDDMAGEILSNIITSAGIDFKVNANIIEISGNESVESVKLDTGEEYPAELVIISCGIRANINIAKEAGIETNRAIIVNDKMETNDKYIYACGDCAEFESINYGIWPEAMDMGKIAGANAAGDNIKYSLVAPTLTFEGMNTSLFSAGDNGKNPDLNYKYIEIFDKNKKQLEKYYFVDDKFIGTILIGDTKKMTTITEALNKKEPFNKFFNK